MGVAPRACPCGQARPNRGPSTREVFTCPGPIELRRRWSGSRCDCTPGGYRADDILCLDGGLGPRLQRKACLAAASSSFARSREYLQEFLGVSPASETLRAYRVRQAGRVQAWQGQEAASAEAFRRAEGSWKFPGDAGKVHTIEAGWGTT